MKTFIRLFVLLLFAGAAGCLDKFPDNPLQPKSTTEAGQIISFSIKSANNPSLSKDIVFSIYNNGNITGYASSKVDLTSLKPSFEVENGTFTVDGTEQQSDVTANDFSRKKTYVLTGSNGRTATYTVHLVPYTGLPVVTITTNGYDS